MLSLFLADEYFFFRSPFSLLYIRVQSVSMNPSWPLISPPCNIGILTYGAKRVSLKIKLSEILQGNTQIIGMGQWAYFPEKWFRSIGAQRLVLYLTTA